MLCIISLINNITSDEALQSGFAEVRSSYMLNCFAGEGK